MTYNHRVILRTISVIMLFEGCAMLIPLVCAVYYQEWGAASAFFFTAICCICFGMTVFKHLRYYTLKIKTREGFFRRLHLLVFSMSGRNNALRLIRMRLFLY